ncbi:MAG: DeoR/GlpR family DNA-binding transcription regulator [Spirochaetales bacterium]|nr:DeoR/GlpR family DNA-binding transcription regulator [Spirochaetales bacterium]
MKIISRLRNVSVQDLTERTGVSEVTIRKDLTILEEAGLVVRTHGGAQLAEDITVMRDLESRSGDHVSEKRQIASLAARLVSGGDTIYLDSGSTCALLAEQIVGMSLRVVTNSIAVMNALVGAHGITLFSIGGSYRREAGSFVGPLALENVKEFQIETCFVGATGVSGRGVFSSQNILESQLKSEILNVSRRRIVLADTSKFSTAAFSIFARTGDVDVIIAEHDFEDAASLRELGIEVLLADQPESV